MTKIIAFIVSLLLTVFPDSTFLECKSQELAYPGDEVVCSEISKAIKSNNIEAIENMYCEADKNDTEKELTEQIKNLIDTIEGRIIKAEKEVGLGSGSDYSNYGVYKSKRDYVLRINTTDATYLLYIFWVTVDTESPENVGMSSIMLCDLERNKLAEAY